MELYSIKFDKFMDFIYNLSMIKRFYSNLSQLIKPHRVLIIYGPRRVGKTTLLKTFLNTTKLKYKLDSGDNIRTQEILSSQDFPLILSYVEGYDLVAIDEAQQIPNIGMGLKIIIDQAPNIQVIATGSSSFDLANQVGEPLTGRKITITLYPIAQSELLAQYNKFELKQKLEEFLIFGSYPEVITAKTRSEKITILQEIVSSYLLKDILTFEKVKSSQTIFNLLKLLAFQIGNQVSQTELATSLAIDVKTVGRYLDLLEKAFVIMPVTGFSRNLRSEIVSKNKYYFLDPGIRNAVISQFNGLPDRNDAGQLFENFIILERMKKRSHQHILRNAYYWRTYKQQEIDLVEEGEGKLESYEVKWGSDKRISAPKDWQKSYQNATFQIINRENYLDFII